MKRVFWGIQLPEQVKQALRSKLEWMEAYRSFLKIVPPANLHLTLKFLGAVPDTSLAEILIKVKEAMAGIQMFRTSLCGWGTFPDRRPAVLWAGLAEETLFSPIYQQSEAFFESLGFPREHRPFKAHITAARTGRIYPPADFFERWHAMAPLTGLSFDVRRVTLFESLPAAPSPVYHPLADVDLEAA